MALQRKIALVAYSAGEVGRYPITPRVEISFEKNYKVGIANAFNTEGGSTRLYQLAWEAMKAASNGEVVPGFDAWVDTIEALDVDLEVVNPFGDTARAGGSQNSALQPA